MTQVDDEFAVLADLRAAEEHSMTETLVATDQVVQGCPFQREAIEVRVLDESDLPIADVLIELAKTADQVVRTKSDAYGQARFDGLLPGEYELGLPLTDRGAWSLIETIPLGHKRTSTGDAPWSTPSPPEEVDAHTVILGECLASIAFERGFLPETIWNFGPNLSLRSGRKDGHILHPGDLLKIPSRQRKIITATTGNRYDLRRRGATASINLRFLDFVDQPITNAPYLLSIESSDGSEHPDCRGCTDSEGFVRSPIPATAIRGSVSVKVGEELHIVNFDLGYVNPIDELSGGQARLNNLGYSVGPEDGLLDEYTKAGLSRFQVENSMAITGQFDEKTKQTLNERFLS
ncbi:MAG: hypothetical protein FIA97_03630 [Methylococcaceae bacterium]|nr:hypothetical protein [Methylococcaceae bacterium]